MPSVTRLLVSSAGAAADIGEVRAAGSEVRAAPDFTLQVQASHFRIADRALPRDRVLLLSYHLSRERGREEDAPSGVRYARSHTFILSLSHTVTPPPTLGFR